MTEFDDAPNDIAGEMHRAAELGEMKYSRYLDDDARAVLETLSAGERAYLWAYLEETVPSEIGKALLNEMWKGITEANGKKPRGLTAKPTKFVAKPFEHAEKSISAHSVFGKSLLQRQFGV